jgi:hypothetical protein
LLRLDLEDGMLHKTSRLLGFHLIATDGEIGHVDDILVDENWTVRYLVVDTSNWIGGKSVLISPAALEKVDSPAKELRVRMKREEIEHSPSVETADIELIETLPPVMIM